MPNFEVEPCYIPVMEKLARLEDGKEEPKTVDLFEPHIFKDAYSSRLLSLKKRLFPEKEVIPQDIPIEEEPPLKD